MSVESRRIDPDQLSFYRRRLQPFNRGRINRWRRDVVVGLNQAEPGRGDGDVELVNVIGQVVQPTPLTIRPK